MSENQMTLATSRTGKKSHIVTMLKKKEKRESWNCSVCTLENEPEDEFCAACNAE